MKILPRNIIILYTLECNARCRHCCFSCSPDQKEKLNVNTVKNIIDDIIKYPSITNISFSGGEIFLYPDEILELLFYARSKGLNIQCTTNGFWGENIVIAERIMKRLQSVNLSTLTISFDEFHKEFISVESIDTLIQLAAKYRIHVEIKGVAVNGSKSVYELLNDLPHRLLDVNVKEIICLPVGRAFSLVSKNQYLVNPTEYFTCPSIGRDVTIYPQGYVVPCCSPVPNPKTFNIGNINNNSLSEIINSYNDMRIKKIYKYGLINEITDENRQKSICEICSDYLERGDINESKLQLHVDL
ncbi:MAG: radical SAM protein [Eubacteriales bacterium]